MFKIRFQLTSRSAGAAQIAGFYIILGILWILFSDAIAASLFTSPTVLIQVSMLKGWAYIVVTALLLFLLIMRHTRELARSEARNESLARLYRSLSAANQALVRASNEEQLFQRVCDSILNLSEFRVAWIGTVDEERRVIRPRAAAGTNSGLILGGIAFPLDPAEPQGDSLAAMCLRSRSIQVSNDYASNDRFQYWRGHPAFSDTASAVCLPIGSNGNSVGVLAVSAPLPNFFEPALLQLFEEMASDISFGLDGLARDLTLRETIGNLRAAQEEALTLNAELEDRVEDRTRRLEEANRELEAFAYSVSHDLRSPLRAIEGYSRILEEDHRASLNEEGLRLLGVVVNETRRMGQLIESLLAFSRLGRSQLQLEEIDMAAMANAAWNELCAGEPDRNIVFQLDKIPPVTADRNLIHQVWTNLLSNARKFTSKTEQATIHIDWATEGEDTFYRVSDNGVGFDMRHAGRLFGVFQRLHSQAEFAGTGAGLAIVERIVRRHGGWIRAKASPGQGATFSFAIPSPQK